MTRFVCVQCGVQFAERETPPSACPICEDDRQFVRWEGQAWTTMAALAADHGIQWDDDLGLPGLTVAPEFAIGQRALLIPEADGCVMWDCLSLVTPEAVARIRSLGGLKAIAISHPHFYSAMAEWSDAFGGVPIHLHAADADWVMRPHPAVSFWSGQTGRLSPDLTLVHCGGHFPGTTVLHWSRGAEGRGALLVGDAAHVAMDRRGVSFMYSYPNFVPLNGAAVRTVAAALAPFGFDRIYGAFRGRNIATGARAAFDASVARYLQAIA